MNISAKTEYACLAVLELAVNADQTEPVRIRDIAEKHGIPSRFLVQILLQLKNAGLVSSVRGAAGGYQLAGDPAEISLGDVMAVVEGKANVISSNTSADTSVSRALHKAWQQIADQQQAELDALTLAELAESVRSANEHMYYI